MPGAWAENIQQQVTLCLATVAGGDRTRGLRLELRRPDGAVPASRRAPREVRRSLTMEVPGGRLSPAKLPAAARGRAAEPVS